MSATAVLLCSHASVAGAAPQDAVSVDDLCGRPAAAAAALAEAAASHVVLGICERRPSAELVAALRRAGAAPFGIEAVALAGREPREARRLLEAARARLDALPAGERGRPTLNGGAISRRTLFSLGGAVTQAPVAVLDETACAGASRCGLCVEHCRAAAIEATAPFPTIDSAACTACGRCVLHCPQGALRLAGVGAAQIEAQLEQLVFGVDGVVFACAAADADAPRGWALVELPTLALVGPGWILQLRARGLEVRLAPCRGTCCAGVPAVEECADRILRGVGATGGRDGGGIELSEPRATVEAIRRLGVSGSTDVLEAEASPLGLLVLDSDRCTLCGACAAACPTDALGLSETAEQTVLAFRAAACVACVRCATACPEDALDVRAGIDFARLELGSVELARAAREVCSGCGADLPPQPMRRRLREILPELAAAPLDLCTRCARSIGSPPAALAPRKGEA